MLDSATKFIIEKLNSLNFEAYAVGGCIRNYFLGVKNTDIDITTSAVPKQIIDCFSDFKIVKNGIKHGTITVIIDNKPYEITTFRTDGEYSDKRHPDKVKFALSLEEDLSRRDFTMNSIAYHPEKGIIDKYNGVEDIKNKVIRCVGNPTTRFNEDALRILRAVRFSSQLSFQIDSQTKDAANALAQNIENISKERILGEFLKILMGDNVEQTLLDNKEIIFQIVPELRASDNFNQKSLSHFGDVYQHTARVVGSCEKDITLRLTAFFHDSGKPYSYFEDEQGYRHFNNHWIESKRIASEALRRLKAPKKMVETVSELCFYHDNEMQTKYVIKKLINERGLPFFELLLKHKVADINAHSPHGIEKYKHYYDNTFKLFNEIIKNKECYSISMMDFKGTDVKKLGVSDNKIGEILKAVFDDVISEKVENKKLAIRDFIIHNYL